MSGSLLSAQPRDIRSRSVYYPQSEQLKHKWQYYYDYWAEQEVPHGRYSGWSKSGVLVKDCFYREGKLDSLCTLYYPTGEVREITHWKAGEKWGRFAQYNKAGIKLVEGHYHQGKLQGTYIEYDRRGNIRRRMTYQKGQADGPVILYTRSGKERRQLLYHQGKKEKVSKETKTNKLKLRLPAFIRKWLKPQQEQEKPGKRNKRTKSAESQRK